MSTPEWYNEDKLVKIKYESHERGWAIDMGNGLYRLANAPIRSLFGGPGWGDLVRLNPDNGDESWLIVVEKYVPPEPEKKPVGGRVRTGVNG